jgi:NAD-specific glutamate dehydrogenase
LNVIAQNSESSAQLSNDVKEVEEVEVVEIVEKEKDDLLDIVVDTIENLDVAGVEITDLFKSILTLSKKAVESSNADKVKELEEKNKALEEQIRQLKGHNQFLDSELLKEKERTQKAEGMFERLISDMGAVWKEIDQFERLTGKQKLKQINSHSTRMKYIVKQFGNVEVLAN